MVDSRFENVTQPLIGFADLVGRDVRVTRFLQFAFSDLFTRWGYEEIMVPVVERASSFSEEVIGGSPWPEWDKRGVFYVQLPGYDASYADLPEQEPGLLVPEGTISVSRWLAGTHRAGTLAAPRKIFYNMPCFRNELLAKLSPTKGRQFHQAGIEILGTDDRRADLEVLLLAHEGFVRVGVPADSILVRIGSVGLFNALCAETGISESDVLVVKDLMDTIAEARAGKDPERLEPSIAQSMEIVRTYAPNDNVMVKWERFTHTHTAELDQGFTAAVGHEEMVDGLNHLASAARRQGLRCVIDPTVVRSHEYYTGIVYELDIQLPGRPPLVEVAGGGRYNKLIGKFLGVERAEVAVPAVGFAYGVERVAEILRQVHDIDSEQVELRAIFRIGDAQVDTVVVAAAERTDEALCEADRLRTQGQRVDFYVGDDDAPEVVQRYADRLGAKLLAL